MSEYRPSKKLIERLRNEAIEIFTLENVVDILAIYDIEHYSMDLSKVFGTNLFGYVDYLEKKIYLNRLYGLRDQRKTIIHELLHAIKDYRNIPDKEEWTSYQEKFIYDLLYTKPRR